MKKKHTKRTILYGSIFFLLLVIPTISFTQVSAIEPTELFDSTFDTQIEALMDLAKAPSTAFSVVKGNEIFYSKGYGEQSGTDIVYYTMQLTYPLTTTAILQLQEDTLLDIDDPINDYLPYTIRNPYYPSVNITIKDLLAEQAALAGNSDNITALINNQDLVFPDFIYDLFNEGGSYYSTDNWLNLEPGTVYKNAWLGFEIAAYIIELVSGKTYEQYLQENIFTPLGMTDSYLNQSDVPSNQLVKRYIWNSTSGVNEEHPPFNATGVGSAGVLSTVDDLAKFLAVLMNNGIHNNVRILEETSVQLMHTETDNNYGLGWFTGIYAEYKGLNAGPWLGYATMVYTGDVGVVLFTNQGLFDEGYAGKHQDLLDYVLLKAEELLPDPTETSFGFLALPIVLAVLGTIMVAIRRRK
ncbi:MAG: serine hydrolase [Candidatus Heimdallarchaeota archaeon]|nr:serine hydrolase [Candidatus Heimdallarchaeota archaeon]MCK4954646.1 serine hydrolase [Candidatus Heimdallarchaeota archaeon]